MKFKRIMRWDSREKKLRLFRIIWNRGEVGDGKGFSACFSVALVRKLFKFDTTIYDQVRVVIFGLSLHYMRSYGGKFV